MCVVVRERAPQFLRFAIDMDAPMIDVDNGGGGYTVIPPPPKRICPQVLRTPAARHHDRPFGDIYESRRYLRQAHRIYVKSNGFGMASISCCGSSSAQKKDTLAMNCYTGVHPSSHTQSDGGRSRSNGYLSHDLWTFSLICSRSLSLGGYVHSMEMSSHPRRDRDERPQCYLLIGSWIVFVWTPHFAFECTLVYVAYQ